MSEEKKTKVLVTSALPYVNNTPHLGNVVGCVLSADVYARYLRSPVNPKHNETEVLYVGGVDEYGTASEMKARELGISCKELCDKNYNVHKEVYDWFLIDFDCYGRTSQPNGDPADPQLDWPHTAITREIFESLCKKGCVIEKEEKVMYCPEIDAYVADRYVIGTCPHCGSEKADGDQCDACGKLLSPTDLKDPKYKLNPSFGLEVRVTENLYIDTPKVWDDHKMTPWFEERKGWTKTASIITRDWLNRGIEPRSITRDLKWGTLVPDTPEFGDKYGSKVFYVWFDAPIGYISITESAIGKEHSEGWWRDPETSVVQFMAKDNVPFHSIIFPVTLRGSGYSEIQDIKIVSTDYLMFEGQKFSKSKGTGLFCDQVIEISERYDLLPDYWRAYLIFIRPENSDSNFVLNFDGGFVDFINNILIKNLGNLLHRVISIAFQIKKKHGIDELIDPDTEPSDIDQKFQEDVDSFYQEFRDCMEGFKFADGIKTTFKISGRMNRYVNSTEPWNLIKDATPEGKRTLHRVIYTLYSNVQKLSHALESFMPTICKKIRSQYLLEVLNDQVIVKLPQEKPKIMISPSEKIEVE